MIWQLCFVYIIQQFCMCADNCVYSNVQRNCVRNFKLLDICLPTNFDATHTCAVDDSGHNIYACTTQLGTHLIKFLTTRAKQHLIFGVEISGRCRQVGKQLIESLDRGTHLAHHAKISGAWSSWLHHVILGHLIILGSWFGICFRWRL